MPVYRLTSGSWRRSKASCKRWTNAVDKITPDRGVRTTEIRPWWEPTCAKVLSNKKYNRWDVQIANSFRDRGKRDSCGNRRQMGRPAGTGLRIPKRDAEYQRHNGESSVDICAITVRVVCSSVSEHVRVRGVFPSESDYLTCHSHGYRTSHSSMALLVLTAEHVSRITVSFTTEDLQSIVARAFFSHSHHVLVSPHRASIDMSEHRALFMPARISDVGTSIKVVSAPLLSGDKRGIPGSTLVLDEKTGATKAIINARSLTALRTAAGTSFLSRRFCTHPTHPTLGSVLATALLHPPATASFRHLVVFGAGLQASAHIRQLRASYPLIGGITIINRKISARLDALVDDLSSAYPGVACGGLSSADRSLTELAVHTADIICCATPSTAPLFPSEWVRPGTHLILVGSYTPEMAEVDSALIRRARVVLVDSRSACAVEAGELIAADVPQARMVEVGELIRHAPAPARDSKTSWEWKPDAHRVAEVLSAGTGDVTIYKSVGIGEQDVAIAVATVERAMEMGIGTVVPDFEGGSDA